MSENIANIEFKLIQPHLGVTCFWRIVLTKSSNEENIPLGEYLAKVPRDLADSPVSGMDVYKSQSAMLYKTQLETADLCFGLNQEVPITEELLKDIELPICKSVMGFFRPDKENVSFQYIDLDFCERIN